MRATQPGDVPNTYADVTTLVAATGEHELALLGLHDRGSGVLAARQFPRGGGHGVLEMRVDDEAVIIARLGVFQLLGQLREVGRWLDRTRFEAPPEVTPTSFVSAARSDCTPRTSSRYRASASRVSAPEAAGAGFKAGSSGTVPG